MPNRSSTVKLATAANYLGYLLEIYYDEVREMPCNGAWSFVVWKDDMPLPNREANMTFPTARDAQDAAKLLARSARTYRTALIGAAELREEDSNAEPIS